MIGSCAWRAPSPTSPLLRTFPPSISPKPFSIATSTAVTGARKAGTAHVPTVGHWSTQAGKSEFAMLRQAEFSRAVEQGYLMMQVEGVPLSTVRLTVEFNCTRVPAGGVCASTSPGLMQAFREDTFGTRPTGRVRE